MPKELFKELFAKGLPRTFLHAICSKNIQAVNIFDIQFPYFFISLCRLVYKFASALFGGFRKVS